MLFLKYLLIAVGVGLFGGASGVVAYDIYLAAQFRRLLGRKSQEGGTEAGERPPRPLAPLRWKLAQQLAMLSVAPFLLGPGIVVVGGALSGMRANEAARSSASQKPCGWPAWESKPTKETAASEIQFESRAKPPG